MTRRFLHCLLLIAFSATGCRGGSASPTAAPDAVAPTAGAVVTYTPSPTEETPPVAEATEPATVPAEATEVPTEASPVIEGEGAPTATTETIPTSDPAATVEVTATAGTAGGTTPRPFASPEYGMQAFMWWRPEVADRDLGLIKNAGFGWVKQDFPWREIEGGGKGQFDWTRPDTVVEMAHDRFGVKILARVDRQPGWATGGRCSQGVEMGPPDNLQDWADFLTALATRYKGRIAAYAVWNEPNLAREWCGLPPDPAAYMQLLRTAYQAIKAADPDAIVISAGLTPTGGPMPLAMEDTEYLDKMYQAAGGSMNGYADVVGMHAPGFNAPPHISGDEVMSNQDLYGRGRYFTFRRVEDLRAIMERYGDVDRQVAILEMGWTTDPRPDSPYNWHAVTPEEQGQYLVEAFQYARQNWSPWIGLMSVIYICNVDWTEADEQYYWCLNEPVYPATITRPAYDALAAMPK